MELSERHPQQPEQQPTKETSSKLATLLRGFGAAAVLLSLYSFLLQGWEGSSDLMRYLMLLGHTALLAVIALISGHVFREGKGPRLLMILALVSVPVNFAILGAFVFSTTTGAAINYPSFVTWSLENLSTALILTASATAILVPVVIIAFRTLVRGMSAAMSTLFILGNIALLLPARDPALVFFISAALGIYTLFISARNARQRTEVKTFEGMIALLLQFLPVGILLGRNMWLYAQDVFLFTAILTLSFIVLRHITQAMASSSGIRSALEALSAILALGIGFSSAIAALDSNLHASASLLIGGAMASALLYELAHRANQLNQLYRATAVLTLTTGVLINLAVFGDIFYGAFASLLSLTIGIAGIFYGTRTQQRSLVIGGAILAIAGLSDQALSLFYVFDVNYWMIMAVAGVAAIVFASLLESRSAKIKHSLHRYKEIYSGWSY